MRLLKINNIEEGFPLNDLKMKCLLFGSIAEILDVDYIELKSRTKAGIIQELLQLLKRKGIKNLTKEYGDLQRIIKIIVKNRFVVDNEILNPSDEIIIFYPAEGSS